MSIKNITYIDYTRYEIELKFLTQGVISAFFNNTLRGGFGYFLKKTLCLSGKDKCSDCILFDTCPYVYIFETHPPKNSKVLKKSSNICQPFVFYTHHKYGEKIQADLLNNNITLYLTLFGRGIELFPYFIFALKRLGEEGLGREKIIFSVEKIFNRAQNSFIYEKSDGDKIKPCVIEKIAVPITCETGKDTNVEVCLLSPTRIQKSGSVLAKPDSEIFIKTLLRRIYNIALFHCSVDIPWDYRDIIQKLSKIRILTDNTETVWTDRYSTRQNQRITMKGIIGNFTLGSFPSSMLPLLEAGEILHVGKNTGFGFGKYKINTGGQIA